LSAENGLEKAEKPRGMAKLGLDLNPLTLIANAMRATVAQVSH
jgi:hypothetical protein